MRQPRTALSIVRIESFMCVHAVASNSVLTIVVSAAVAASRPTTAPASSGLLSLVPAAAEAEAALPHQAAWTRCERVRWRSHGGAAQSHRAASSPPAPSAPAQHRRTALRLGGRQRQAGPFPVGAAWRRSPPRRMTVTTMIPASSSHLPPVLSPAPACRSDKVTCKWRLLLWAPLLGCRAPWSAITPTTRAAPPPATASAWAAHRSDPLALPLPPRQGAA